MQEAVSSHRQEGLKVLVRVKGQGKDGQPLGPWPLDIERKSMKEVRFPCSVRSCKATTCTNFWHCAAQCQFAVLKCVYHGFATV